MPAARKSELTSGADASRRLLREAMERLLAGKTRDVGLHNGKLTVSNLAQEAGVGRSTLYRQPDLVEEFERRRRTLRKKAPSQIPVPQARAQRLADDLKNARRHIQEQEARENLLAQQIQVLTLQLANERTEREREAKRTVSTVVPLRTAHSNT